MDLEGDGRILKETGRASEGTGKKRNIGHRPMPKKGSDPVGNDHLYHLSFFLYPPRGAPAPPQVFPLGFLPCYLTPLLTLLLNTWYATVT